MKNITKQVALALTGVALFSACSRPYATYQPSASARIATQEAPIVAARPATAPVLAPVAVDQPAVTEAATVAPAPAIAAVREQLAEAVASNKAAVSDKRVQKRLARVNDLLTVAERQSVTAPAVASAHKLTLTERLMMKKVAKKINRTLAPDQTQATSNTRLGLIIGVIGLLLILVGGIAGSGAIVLIGLIGLIIGLVLLLLGLANA